MDVSVIIVNWNTRDLLENCLKSVQQQCGDVTCEVIVIDNGSTDGSADMVSERFPVVTLLRNSFNKGFASANNQGIAVARGRYVLLLNSDTLILDKAIEKTVHFADAHPDVAAVGCRVLNPDRTLQPTCFMFPSLLNLTLSATYLYKLFPRSRFFGREQMTWWDRSDVREVDVVTGCCMLARREAIGQVGMMDERFFMYAEETDWCYRFRKAGWKVVFAPVAEIVHMGGCSSEKVRSEMLVQLRLSILKFIGKHQGWLSYKIACVLTVVFFVLRLPVWLVVSVFGVGYRKLAAIAKMQAYLNGIRRLIFEL